MIGVQLSGGLGNQMFEYALYLKLKSMGRDVKVDDFTCYGPGTRQKMLERFGVSYERLSEAEYIALTDSSLRLRHRIRRKITGRRDLSYRERSTNYDPEVLTREPALLLGCFQTEKYFSDIAGQVREAYGFRGYEPVGANREYDRRIRESLSVGVHIRRGDYLDPKYSALYRGICDDGYYERAMLRIQSEFPEAEFFFFSNDPEWVKKHYQGPRVTVIEGHTEEDGFADLYLMSRCRHQIIANSSFSWWAAWLNANPDKRVIAPGRWLNVDPLGKAGVREACTDIYTKEMILL